VETYGFGCCIDGSVAGVGSERKAGRASATANVEGCIGTGCVAALRAIVLAFRVRRVLEQVIQLRKRSKQQTNRK
jgi:hypothetical protein